MKAETAHAFAQPGSTDAPRAAAGRGSEIFSIFSMAYARERREAMSLAEFLEGCRDDPGMTASAAERMIAAVGDPVVVDTARDPRLGRIFLNRTIKLYPSLSGFFGMEDTIQRVVSFFQHAAQGLRRAQADPLPPWSGRRRQVFARRAPQGVDRDAADLCAGRRRRTQPGV